MYRILKIYLLVLALFLPLLAVSQKFEKEYRIETEEVPEKAFQFIHSEDNDFSEKWYYEENLDGNSIEAKFKYNRKKYSIEFDTLGNLLDIEVESPFKDLPDKLQASINNSLQKTYSKFTVKKMQVQYSGAIDSFADFIAETEKEKQYTIYFELVVKGRKNRKWNLYEMTYNNRGELEKTEQIILRNTDNLEF
jgi:hypothetical protein